MRLRPPAPRRLERVGVVFARAALLVAVASCRAFGAAPAAAPRMLYPADTVHVAVPRPHDASALRLAPRFAAVLPAQQPADAFADLGERVSHAAGVSVRSFGGPGSLASVSIRGSSSNQVEVFYDGIPLGRARDGIARLADAPLAGLSRVEVSRGFAPFELASAPMGGAINLIPRDDAARAYTLHLAGGSWRTADGSATAGFGGETWRGAAYGTWLSSAGDFAFLDDNATPFNTSDDERTRRRNNARHSLTGGATLTRVLDDRSVVTAVVDASRRRSGLPGIGPVQASDASSSADQLLTHVRASRWLRGDATRGRGVRGELHLYDVATHERFTDTRGELGAGRQDNDDRTATTGVRAQAQWRGAQHELALLGELASDRLRTRDFVPSVTTYPLIRRTTRSAAAEYRWTPWDGRVAIAPSYRVEEAIARSPRVVRVGAALPVRAAGLEPHAHTASPSLAARVAPVEWLALKGHTGRYRRLPSFLELFGERGAVSGNPLLKNETGTHSDLGITLASPDARWSLEVDGFAVRAHDLVVYVQNSQRTSVAQNIGTAHIDGCEATLSAALAGDALRLEANATWQTARDAGDNIYTRGRLLPGRPLREYFASAVARAGLFDVRGEIAHSSGMYLDRTGRLPVAASSTLGAGIAYHAGGRAHGITLTASATNLTDARTADLAGYPLPGRAFYLSVDRHGLWSRPRSTIAAAPATTETARR